MNIDWQEHYKDRKNRPPAPFLVEALPFVQHKGAAVDLGSGDLVDAQFLLTQGFSKVIAIDKELPPPDLLEQASQHNFEFIRSSFDEFNFPKKQYDLINAHYALPFNSQKTFRKVWNGVEQSLVVGGVFVGQFFGVRDEWNEQQKDFTFHTKSEVEGLLGKMEILEFKEEEIDRKLAGGVVKHWHLFHVIAKAAN
jgi:hypothetical protein